MGILKGGKRMRWQSWGLSLAGLVVAASVAHAQTPNWSSRFSAAYAGAIYVSPQDSGFSAPGIYRSVERADPLSNEMTVSPICTRDFRETNALRALYRGVSDAPAVTIEAPKSFAASITGLNARVAELGAHYEAANSAALSTGPLKIHRTDDMVAADVLQGIGKSCRDVIAKHLRAGRVVFIADGAVQSKEFKVTLLKGKKGSLDFKCTFFPLFCPGGSASYNNQQSETRIANNYVTFMLVPAEVDPGRAFLTRRDVAR